MLGVCLGAGLLYLILRAGKLAFGRQQLRFVDNATIVFTDNAVLLPDKAITFGDLFYRQSDTVLLHAQTVNMAGKFYRDVPIRLTQNSLRIGQDEFDPKEVIHLEATTDEITLPRETMGMGDVKLMAAVGAFLGWQAVGFSLVVSCVIGSLVGCGLIATHRRHWLDRLPYGPYIAGAATIWIFAGKQILTLFIS